MKKLLSFFLILAMLVPFAATAQDVHTSSKDTLVIAMSSEPGKLNPFYTDSATLKRTYVQIFDQLFNYDEVSANIVCNAVESYTFDEGYTGITLKLRPDIVFHNGVPATSEDLAYTFKYLSENSLGKTMDYINFEDVTIVDEYTVHVGLKYPYSALLDCLVKVSLICKSAAEEMGESYERAPIGSGPYKFVSWVAGDRIMLEANQDYWKYTPAIKNLIIRIITEQAVQYIELMTGGIDVAMDPLPADVLDVIEHGDGSIEAVNGGQVAIYFINLNYNSDNEAMKNKTVRQAISYAINHDDIATVFGAGMAKSSYSLLPSGVFGYNAEYDANPAYPYDPAKAIELLKEAGYGDGLTLRMINNSNAVFGSIAEVLQNQLAQVGITLDIKTYDSATAADMQENGNDYDILINMVNINGDPIVSPLGTHYDPTKGIMGGRNKSKNANDPDTAVVNDLILQLKQTFDTDARYQIIQDIMKEMMEYCWYIPVFETGVYALEVSNLENYMKVVNYDFFGPAYFE